MTILKNALISASAIFLILCASGGSAQQDSVGDVFSTTHKDDLDSFWADTQNWYWYGYRPYTHVHVSRFAGNLPTWNSSAAAAPGGGYSFGINEPTGNAPWEGGPKVPFQLTKQGTWH
jgi:hypothetical protein